MSRIAEMYLGFQLDDDADETQYQAALAVFDKYWPRSSEPKWKNMLGADDDATFITQINNEFATNIQAQSPFPIKNGWVFEGPIPPPPPPPPVAIGWRVGPEGLHIWTNILSYRISGGPKQDYTFDYPKGTGSGTAIISFNLRWHSARQLT